MSELIEDADFVDATIPRGTVVKIGKIDADVPESERHLFRDILRRHPEFILIVHHGRPRCVARHKVRG